MELTNDLFLPLPNIQDIGSEEVKELYSEEVVKLHLDKVAIQDILIKHLKIPDWELSTEEKITVVCNFNHTTVMSVKSIVRMSVRCAECRSKITELSEIIYNSGLDKKIFTIIRINKLGLVVLKCLSREHKMRITYDIQHPPDLPTYCPECIIDSSPSSKSDEMDLAKHLQSINLAEELGNDSLSDKEEYFNYESYLRHGGNIYEKNIDFDMIDTEDMTDTANMTIDTESDTEQHHPSGGCCSDNDYENYFDKIPFGDEPKSIEDEVAEELEDSQISHIIATVISRNYPIYIEQKEKAHEKLEKL
jgi:hypothetical protein